jgi:hypothetical protein
MTTRILEVTKGTYKWYEVQVRFLWFIWLDADIYNSTYPNVFASLETAMSSLDRLKKPKIKKKVVAKVNL